jgi:hypothetical protein
MLFVFLFSLLALSPLVRADEGPNKFAIKNPDLKIEPFIQLQGWAVYSLDRKAQVDADEKLDGTEQRANLFFRRARLGFRGTPYKKLNYVVTFYYDNAGHDSLAATRATTLPSTTNGRSTDVTKGVASVGLWDTFLSWKLSESDLFNVTAGYFRPQISRESITAAFNVGSFEKSPVQSYVRQSVVGRGFGRATGINVGGLSHEDAFGYHYNLGIFNKLTTGGGTLGETQGDENSLVYVARAGLTFGDPEMKQYSIGYAENYFGRRKGATLSLSGSSQDKTATYKGNNVLGADLLFNWKAWNVSSEFFYIYFKTTGARDYSKSRVGQFRVGHNFYLTNGTILEPNFLISGFYGERGAEYTGRDWVYDFGFNWFLDETKYKFYVHYVKQEGDGENLVHRSGPNGFSYGDYAGAGVTLQF